MVKVELLYIANDGITVHRHMELKQGSTVNDALKEAKIHFTHPETKNSPVGIFAKQVSLETILKEGDRIELYRPLILDPKEKRRQRAQNPGR